MFLFIFFTYECMCMYRLATRLICGSDTWTTISATSVSSSCIPVRKKVPDGGGSHARNITNKLLTRVSVPRFRHHRAGDRCDTAASACLIRPCITCFQERQKGENTWYRALYARLTWRSNPDTCSS